MVSSICVRYSPRLTTFDVQNRIFISFLLIGGLDQLDMGMAKLCPDEKLRFTRARGSFRATSTLFLLFAGAEMLDQHQSFWNFDVMAWGWRTLVSAGIAALIATVIMIAYPSNLHAWPLRHLGNIGYGIYPWHLPKLFALIARTFWRAANLVRPTTTCTAVTTVISWNEVQK